MISESKIALKPQSGDGGEWGATPLHYRGIWAGWLLRLLVG
jgi:hypothetical protein